MLISRLLQFYIEIFQLSEGVSKGDRWIVLIWRVLTVKNSDWCPRLHTVRIDAQGSVWGPSGVIKHFLSFKYDN